MSKVKSDDHPLAAPTRVEKVSTTPPLPYGVKGYIGDELVADLRFASKSEADYYHSMIAERIKDAYGT